MLTAFAGWWLQGVLAIAEDCGMQNLLKAAGVEYQVSCVGTAACQNCPSEAYIATLKLDDVGLSAFPHSGEPPIYILTAQGLATDHCPFSLVMTTIVTKNSYSHGHGTPLSPGTVLGQQGFDKTEVLLTGPVTRCTQDLRKLQRLGDSGIQSLPSIPSSGNSHGLLGKVRPPPLEA